MVQAVLVHTFFRSALFPLIVIVLLVYLASQTLMADLTAQVRNRSTA